MEQHSSTKSAKPRGGVGLYEAKINRSTASARGRIRMAVVMRADVNGMLIKLEIG